MIASLGLSASPRTSDEFDPCIELSFPVLGKNLPADHNYGLYAALVYQVPELHQQNPLSILSISGFPNRQGEISLTQYSCLRIRVPVSKISVVYQLAGKQIHLAGLRQISSPNKAQSSFVSEEYVPIVFQPLDKTERHRCTKRL
jgi:CRISPR-associated endonuclease/helicase Cas3